MTTPAFLVDDVVTAYEADLAARLRVDNVVATSSGTTALQTALAASGVGPGDEVLVPALTVVMTAAPVVALGATPVIVDCNHDGSDFDHADLERKASKRSAAIVPVYLWGRAGDIAWLDAFAAARGLPVVADACQALGTSVDGRQVGTTASVACFSTHQLKIMSTGEGGFLTTDDSSIAARARAYRSHWLTPPPGEAPLGRLAHNFRLAEPLAAIGRGELARLDELLARRRFLTHRLYDALTGVPQLTAIAPTGQDWNAYAPLLKVGTTRPRELCQHLAAVGVPNSTGSFRLIPLDQRPMFQDTVRAPGCLSAALVLDELLAVVITRHDGEDEIDRLAETIRREVAQWPNG